MYIAKKIVQIGLKCRGLNIGDIFLLGFVFSEMHDVTEYHACTAII